MVPRQSRHSSDVPNRTLLGLAFIIGVMALCVFGVAGAGGFHARAAADDEKKDEKKTLSQDSLDRDYSSELPRIAPVEPDKALELFVTAPGFHMELAACEPLVVDPVAMAFDEDGRLYVVEMRDYSEDDKLRLGRVRLLVDEDDDGRFDRSTVFADDLSWPTAITCYDGGVFVGVAPDILYLKDTDGDGRADQREVVFTGFGRSNVQGLMNSFLWGLDNRIWGATSSSGAQVVRPDRPQEAPLVLRGRDFAFDPRTRQITPETGGGQHGMTFNRWGDRFVCSNSDHVQMIVLEDRYLARNPFAVPPPARISIAADGPQADVFRVSPVEPWRIVRTRLRVQGLVPGPVEGGGRPAGYFTSATGITVYQGDAWPATPFDLAVVGDVGSNIVHRKKLIPDGVKYRAERIDANAEFVASRDIWFRPVQFANAPDGTLYVLDMYREVVEHPASIPPIIKRHLDLTSGRDRGRIYRIVPDGYRRRPTMRLSNAPSPELVALLDHPNGWHRTTAARLLWQRQDRSVVPLLERLVGEATLAEGRIHALWALQGLGALRADTVWQALEDSHPQVRRHAARLAEPFLNDHLALRARLAEKVDDPDMRVCFQAALSLGATHGELRDEALARLAARAGDDPYIRFAIQSGLADGTAGLLTRLALDSQRANTPGGRAVLAALCAQLGRQQRPEDVASLLRVVSQIQQQDLLRWILSSLAVPPDSPLAQQIAAATGGKSQQVFQQLLEEARKIAGDAEQPAERRARAIRQLAIASWADAQDVILASLAADQPAEVQQAAVETLGRWKEPQVADVLIDSWPVMVPALRQRAGDLFVSRPEWTRRWLAALEEGRLSPGDVAPAHWQTLLQHQDEQIRRRAERLAASRQANRQAVLDQYRPALTLEGDPTRGRQVFTKTCAPCHQLSGIGHAIGPNLAAMRNRGKDALLLNILLPNAEVNPQYVNYVLVTKDGRTLNGMIAEESAGAITLLRAENAKDQILRIDIDTLRSTGQSLMPEGVERDIDVQGMADLLAFIMTVESP